MKFFIAIGLATFLAATLATTPAMAQIPVDQDDLLEDTGALLPQWFAELQDVEIQGNYAYAFGVGGLAVIDFSDPSSPVLQSRYEPPGHPFNRYYRGAVGGGLACGGARENLLAIFDISSPFSLVYKGLHGTVGMSYEGAAIGGDFIYACRHNNGIEVIDATDPGSPVTTTEVGGLVNSWDVELSGQHAFVADGAGGLAVLDITEPGLPVLVTSVPTSGAAMDIDVSGTTVVVCNGSAGIDVFDVTNPTDPVLVGTANTSGLAITAAIAGDLVYVADWDDVETFDISNPAFPILVGGEDTPVRAMGLDAISDLVIVADWSRVQLYRAGPTSRGDIHITTKSINFGNVPVGATVDTSFTISNTGGGAVYVSLVEDFGPNFTILDPGPFTIIVGGTQEVGVRFYHAAPGYDATFIKVHSDDTNESIVTFPVQADDNPNLLALGSIAPEFIHVDTEFSIHSLSDYRGRVVVMAFFANW